MQLCPVYHKAIALLIHYSLQPHVGVNNELPTMILLIFAGAILCKQGNVHIFQLWYVYSQKSGFPIACTAIGKHACWFPKATLSRKTFTWPSTIEFLYSAILCSILCNISPKNEYITLIITSPNRNIPGPFILSFFNSNSFKNDYICFFFLFWITVHLLVHEFKKLDLHFQNW